MAASPPVPPIPPTPSPAPDPGADPTSYHARHEAAVAAGRVFALYVPAPRTRIPYLYGVLPGSAIVGQPWEHDAEKVHVYWEGNAYGVSALVSFAEKARTAARRLVLDYPTTAEDVVPASALRRVGSYDYAAGTVTLDDPDAAAAWGVIVSA